MNIRTLLFIGISICVVILILFLFLMFSLKNPETNISSPEISPGVTGFINPSKPGFQLVSSTPANQALGVPLDAKIAVVFNKDIPTPIVTISPTIPISSTTSGRSLIIQSSNPFLPSTTYTITMQLGDQSFFLIFTTLGPTPTPGPNTRDPGLVNKDNEATKQSQPDTFLSNFTPYSDSNFSVTSAFSSALGQFQFTVSPAAGSSMSEQTAFTAWAKKQGLNDNQFSRLSVIYK